MSDKYIEYVTDNDADDFAQLEDPIQLCNIALENGEVDNNIFKWLLEQSNQPDDQIARLLNKYNELWNYSL